MKKYFLVAFCVAICIFMPMAAYLGSLRAAGAVAFLVSITVLTVIFLFRALLWVLKNGKTSPLVSARDPYTGEIRMMSETEADSRGAMIICK